MYRTHTISIICLAGALSITAVFAQDLDPGTFDLTWHTIDGGGGKSSGGMYDLHGTIGQADAGAIVMTGGGAGGFELRGGFWPGASGPQPNTCAPDIAPPPSGNGIVNVDDLLGVINGWGPCPPPCQPYCTPDITHNCVVNVDDLLAVINGWGLCP